MRKRTDSVSINIKKNISEYLTRYIYNQALPPVPHTGITVPGTKWCGPGNTAANFEDLGRERETDKCCRAHDHCDEIIEPHAVLHRLPANTDWFPM